MNEPKHPPLNTPLSAFTPAMLDALPVGSAFGPGLASDGTVVKFTTGWTFGTATRPATGFEDTDLAWDQTRPLIRVGPEQASEPAPMYYSRITRDLTVERSPTGADPWSPCPNAEVPAATAALVMKARREAAELAQLRGHHTMIPTPPLTPCGQVPREVDGQCPNHGTPCPAPSTTLPDPWPGYLVAFTHADVTRRHAIRDSATVNGETVFCPAGGFSEDVYLDWTPDVVQEVRTPDGTTVWKRPAAKVTT